MDILGKLREGAEFVASIPTDIVDTGYNLANTIYYTATGKTLGKPLHSKILVNNITTKLTGKKVFSNIPTENELQNPNKAKEYFKKAVKQNNKELLEIVLQKSTENPTTTETVLQTVDEDFYNKVLAIYKGKASAEEGVVLAREYSLLSELVNKNPEIRNKLPKTMNVIQKLNNNDWLKQHPEVSHVKEAIDKYHTINKTLDMINLLSVATFGAGKIGAQVFKTPLIKAVSHAIATASAGTPIVSGVYRASVNHESLSQAVSPIDAMMIGDVVRGAKDILKTKDAIATYEMYKQLQNPNFNPIEHLLSQLSKKHDLTEKELADFKLAVIQSEKEEFKKSEVFTKALAKDKGDKYSFILDKIISRHNFENELLQNDTHVINAFLEHEPLKEYFKKNHTGKDGRIVIEDINKVEEDLSKMAKKDVVIANFMKYNRQKRLLGELVKAIEHGNTEVSISIFRPSAIIETKEVEAVGKVSALENKVAEEIPAVEDRVIDLTQPLKSIIDEVEKEFSKNSIISITYKTKAGDTVSRAIKPFYAPSNDEFRILKGKFQVLKDDKWEEIEDTFTIPMSRTHQLETTLKEIAREKGYADIKPVEGAVEYIKPATNIFPYKLSRLADRLLKLENTLLKNNQKVKDKEIEEFRKLVEEAYESGYLPPVIKQKVGDQEVELVTPLDYYLQAKPQEIFKVIKNNILQHTKDILSRSKETTGIFKEVIYDEGGSLLKLVENELREYREFVKGMIGDVKDIEKDVLSKTKAFAKDDATLQKELLQTVNSYVKDVGGSLKQIETTVKDIKSKIRGYIKEEGGALSRYLDHELKNIEKSAGGNLKQLETIVKNIKDKAREHIKEDGRDLNRYLNHELNRINELFRAYRELSKIEDLSKRARSKGFKEIFKLFKNEIRDIKASVKGYKQSGEETLGDISNLEKELKNTAKSGLKDLKDKAQDVKASVKGYRILGEETLKEVVEIEKELKNTYAEIKKSLSDVLNIVKTEQGVSKLNKSELLKAIEEDFKLLNESLQKLDTTDLYTSVKGYFETAKESFKDYTLQSEKIESKIKDLSKLAQALTSAERVSLRDNIKLTDLIDKSAMRIDTIADTIKKIATTPYREQKRQGSGFATTFDNYESFKAYASLKYLAPTFQHMKASSFMKNLVEELEELEKRNPHGLNPTQKVVKDFLNLYLNRNMTDFAKAQRMLGNLVTLLNPSIALGNFVASLQSIHFLFPSMNLMKIGEIKHVWNKEFKKMLYTEGLYKYNILNPFYVGIETILKSHVLANLKDDRIFNNVILDYAKQIGIQDEKIIESIKAYYQDRREELADNIINFISGLDARALQVWSIEFAKIGESAMPWYRFIFTPLSVATEIIKRWGDAPEYITRLGLGKTFGKALGFTTFSAIALGSQAVPFMAPVETAYNVVKTFVNTLATIFGEDEVFTDKNFAELVLKELDYNVLKTGLFDPNERVNFYSSFGSALLQAIAGAEAKGWDTNPFIHAFSVGLDFLSKVGASGVISPTAGSYVADIPAPALSIVQNIVKKTMFANDEQTKATQTMLALIQSIPLTNNLYKEIAGKTLVKGVGESGKEEIWQPSLPQELLSKEGQSLLGLVHLVGFMLLHADTIFNGAEIQKATELFRYELATDEEKKKMFSPIKNPEGTDHYKLLSFKDYNVFRNRPEDIITTLKYIPEEDLPKVKERADDLIIKNLNKMVKLVREGRGTDKEIEEIKHRYEALQNYIVVADYLGWDKVSDDLTLDKVRELHRMAYKVLKEKGIDVDYKDILRAKRKLESEKIGSQ